MNECENDERRKRENDVERKRARTVKRNFNGSEFTVGPSVKKRRMRVERTIDKHYGTKS